MPPGRILVLFLVDGIFCLAHLGKVELLALRWDKLLLNLLRAKEHHRRLVLLLLLSYIENLLIPLGDLLRVLCVSHLSHFAHILLCK